MVKKKIINDPLYGFVTIQSELAFEIIEHPYFQRLRQISQLGLSHFVYPGARHTRFQHALGAYHLMGRALSGLIKKGIEITPNEFESAQLAVLLHDIGHGPFSHSLEEELVPGIRHESLSYLFLEKLNKEFNNGLDLTLKIFQNGYKRKFFHELIDSQLDIDRLDYLNRDSFFTGVHEGIVGVDRIIEMLNIKDDSVVVEEKGIYSIESFLTARRLMYWQVYLHKTCLSAERLLVNIVRRAKYLIASGEKLFCSDSLEMFLKTDNTLDHFQKNPKLLDAYGSLDDGDLWGAIKVWSSSRDVVLPTLCNMIIQRRLFRIQLTSEPSKLQLIEKIKNEIGKKYRLLKKDSSFLFSHGMVSNEAYVAHKQNIRVLMKSGDAIDIATASDFPQIKAMSKTVKKNFLCWPKDVDL